MQSARVEADAATPCCVSTMTDPEIKAVLRDLLPGIREGLALAEREVRRVVPLRFADNLAVKRMLGRYKKTREWLEDEASE